MAAVTAPPLESGRRFALDATAGRLTPAERAGRGRAARAAVPRDSHAVYDPPADRPDPVGLLERQAASRVPDLVPVRYGRMLASPFSYFRGAALPMAAGQRLMQAASDIFLGWQRSDADPDGKPHDYYIRQLRDGKLSADIATMTPTAMRAYGELCGWTLAHAHARSGDRIAIAAYLGRSAVFDKAIAEFAAIYADQNERDHQALAAAAASGRIAAQRES